MGKLTFSAVAQLPSPRPFWRPHWARKMTGSQAQMPKGQGPVAEWGQLTPQQGQGLRSPWCLLDVPPSPAGAWL